MLTISRLYEQNDQSSVTRTSTNVSGVDSRVTQHAKLARGKFRQFLDFRLFLGVYGITILFATLKYILSDASLT